MMTALSFNKLNSIIFIALLVVILSIFASNIKSFNKDLGEATKSDSCLEEDNRRLVTDDECYYDYNGTPLMKKFDNLPINKICCQLYD